MFSNEDSPSCPPEQMDSGRCKYNRKRPDLSGTTCCLFTNTDFVSCTCSGNGGAISFSNAASGTLTVSWCFFSSCTCTTTSTREDECGGGAIYVNSVSKVVVSSSLFSSCACYSSNGCDGGAIELWSISFQPLISICIFNLCRAADDGGALSIWESSGLNPFVCTDCTFLSCNCGGTGGCLIMWGNSEEFKGCNMLFASGRAAHGGAFATSSSSSHPNYEILFCFFLRNTASSGNDILFSVLPSDLPILHCLSTSDPQRIAYWQNKNTFSVDYSNWLPIGVIATPT